MVPKKNKLSSLEVRRVFNSYPKRIKRGSFSVIFLDSEHRKGFSVVISSKVAKKAVTRNLLRRCFFSVIEKMLDDFKNGMYVFIVERDIEKSDINAIEKDIKSILNSL